MKDNLNFKTICPLKQREQSTRISYENEYSIYIYPESGELSMEEHQTWSIKRALLSVGWYSQICMPWEIYKLLFILHNVHPIWIEVDINDEYWDQVSFIL